MKPRRIRSGTQVRLMPIFGLIAAFVLLAPNLLRLGDADAAPNLAAASSLSVSANTNGVLVSPSNFWTTNAASISNALHLGSSATNGAGSYDPAGAAGLAQTFATNYAATNAVAANRVQGAVSSATNAVAATYAATATNAIGTGGVPFASGATNGVGAYCALLTVQTGTLVAGTATLVVPSGCHPWVVNTTSTNDISVTVSGTNAVLNGTGSNVFVLFNAGTQ